jgi:hypothetical protein
VAYFFVTRSAIRRFMARPSVALSPTDDRTRTLRNHALRVDALRRERLPNGIRRCRDSVRFAAGSPVLSV